MSSVVSNFFGSVLMRLALVYGAMAVMTGAAIIVGWMVFQSIALNMSVLSDERLPELRNSAHVVTRADQAGDLLSKILMARTFEELINLDKETKLAIEELTTATENLGEEQARILSESIDQVNSALFDLLSAQMDQMSRANSLTADVENALRLATESSALLDQATDDAYFDLVMGADETISTIDATLTQLIESDFALYQATLQMRAEVNLLTGLAMSVLKTSDTAMMSILSDLANAALAQVSQLMPTLEQNEATAELHLIVVEALPDIQRVLSQTGGRVSAERILSFRQGIDAALSSALDDIYFQLVINSDDAKTSNEDSIRTLMDDQVTRIRTQAALDSASKSFFAAAMQTALARDASELAMLQDALLVNREELHDAMAGAPQEIIDKIEQMLEISAPDTGIAATRSAALAAQASAAVASNSAANAVQKIATDIGVFAANAQNEIDETAAALNKEVALARARMQQIGFASLVLVTLAPLLIWIMVTRPLNKVTSVTERLAQGDLSEIENVGTRHGEIARMAKALQVFRSGALERIQLQDEDKRRQAEAVESERAAERAQREAEARDREAKETQAREEREREAKENERNEKIRAEAEAERKARSDEQEAVVSELAKSLKRLSVGDLTHTIETEFPGAYEALRQDFNAAINNLAELMRQIGDSSESIDASSAEIASSSLDLSRRTEKSAATLEETAAALSELTSSVSTAAKGASNASSTVDVVKNDAQSSRKVMHQAVGAMSEIEESSAKISKIVEVIDGIAFQTNLLALNAGVEAARAGDAGRGFAVVASEVRSLAHRCSEAALQISNLISESTNHVENGVSLIDKTSSALETILKGIFDVSQNVNEIANSVNEQSSGIGEINSAMEQLDRSTQQNAAMFETTTAASQALTGESGKLAKLVSGFVVRNSSNQNMADEDELMEESIQKRA
ncbi:methyl-accepting chemotaxis protein [Roseobacter sp.]|uniref:methyl-accepting chemotaxis protein n=1 Tax=Roseobacter sp. TaxID=1907202 RepID=UPI00385DFD40